MQVKFLNGGGGAGGVFKLLEWSAGEYMQVCLVNSKSGTKSIHCGASYFDLAFVICIAVTVLAGDVSSQSWRGCLWRDNRGSLPLCLQCHGCS